MPPSRAGESLAAASVAQVHRARLKQDYRPISGDVLRAGTVVVIKVLRPGIEPEITADLGNEDRTTDRFARDFADDPRVI